MENKENFYEAFGKTCCFTGRRNIPLNRVEDIKKQLKSEIYKAIKDGYDCFISGFADGTDMMSAWAVAEIKNENNKIKLIGAIPYRKRMYAADVKKLLSSGLVDDYVCVSEEYNAGCYHKRNRFMVDRSSRVIAVIEKGGEYTGGTGYTINYAVKNERNIKFIYI